MSEPAGLPVGARVERIRDPADARLDDYRDVRDAELRRRRGLFVAEGREIVRRLLAAPRFRARSVLLTEAALASVGPLAASSGVPVYLAAAGLVQAVVGYAFHRGCLAVAERGPSLPLTAVADPPGPRLLAVVEDLANPDNVGGVFRNALAFGADGVVLSAASADPLYRKAIRVSAGACLRVPFARVGDWPAGLRTLGDAGYRLVALTPDPSAVDIADVARRWPVTERLALLVGSEDRGLRPETRTVADLEVTIPMIGAIDSLNAATAVAIALHRLRSR